MTRLHQIEAQGIDWTLEMHARGINMRHLGWLRSQYWHKLAGSTAVIFGTSKILCSQDISREVRRGEKICINNIMYTMSNDLRYRQGPDMIYINETIKVISGGDLIATTGFVSQSIFVCSMRHDVLF